MYTKQCSKDPVKALPVLVLVNVDPEPSVAKARMDLEEELVF